MNQANLIWDGDPESQRLEQDAFFAHGWRVYSLADERYLWEPTSECLIRQCCVDGKRAGALVS